jgi:outer membrane lipoprotein-sorting protein
MLQSWMGTDFTNDDMVKQSSLVDDYKATVIATKGSIVTLELIPRRSAAVVWGKIISKVDTKYYTQIEDLFYDDDGKKVRKMSYSRVKKFGSHYVTTEMVIVPFEKSKKGNKTIIKILDAKFDQGIDNTYFSKQALKRYSR